MKKLLGRALALLLTLAVAAPVLAQLLPPLPGASLVVTLTSPSQGANVSGTIPVSASVSIVGSLTVSRVEFFANGNFIGSDSGSPYSVSWNTTTVGNGSHSLSAVAVDVLGVRWTSNSVTVNVSNGPPPDTTAPSVSITFPGNGATVSGSINVTASASDNVGVASVQFRLDGVNAGAPDTSAPYSIAWNTTGSSNGAHTISAVARDAAGNTRTSTAVSVTVANDKTSPTVSINRAATQADPTSASPINFTVVFSEPVSGFTGTDVTISGTAGGTKTRTVTGGPSTYNVAVSGMTSSGTVVATIGAGLATDAAGNTNVASTSTDNSVQFNLPDTTRPSVTINQATNQADPTSASPINFTVVFSESVGDFTGSDVAIGGTAGATTAAVSGGPSTYNVALSGMTSSGTVSATIPAGVASDAAANTNAASTSTDNSVQFSVDVPPPPPTATRFEETDPAVGASPAGAWVLRGAEIAAFSGGTAGISNLTGATVTFTFSGTAVSWIGLRCNLCGIATVSIDGGAPAPVDTAGAGAPDGSLAFEVVFSASGLDPAVSHTMVITVAGNTSSGGAFIVVDAFDVAGAGSGAPPTVTRAEESAATFTGSWSTSGAETGTFSGGTMRASNVAGSTAAFTFTGTAVSWIGAKCGICGIGAVSIDGGDPIPVDTAGAAAVGSLAPEVVFTSPALAAGAHTVVITVSGDAFVVVDAFDVTGGTGSNVTRIEDTDPSVSYTPPADWIHGTDDRATGGTFSESTTAGAEATLSFTGTEVLWIGFANEHGGLARVFLDGADMGVVDQYSTEAQRHETFRARGLASGPHTLRIVVTGERNASSTSSFSFVLIDAFDVTP